MSTPNIELPPHTDTVRDVLSGRTRLSKLINPTTIRTISQFSRHVTGAIKHGFPTSNQGQISQKIKTLPQVRQDRPRRCALQALPQGTGLRRQWFLDGLQATACPFCLLKAARTRWYSDVAVRVNLARDFKMALSQVAVTNVDVKRNPASSP